MQILHFSILELNLVNAGQWRLVQSIIVSKSISIYSAMILYNSLEELPL